MKHNDCDTEPHSLMLKPNDYWATPQSLFDELHREFNFTIDVCANADNAKLPRYWTEEDDALSKSWAGERCFMNPPYSQVERWLKKAWSEGWVNRGLVVALINVATDTEYWHNYVEGIAEVRFLRGRVKFVPPPGIKASTPRYASAICIF